jgi:hypothetical protein
MPDGQVRRRGATVYDSHSSAVVSPAPARFRFLARGLASCCDTSMIEASALFRAPADRIYTYTVRAAAGPPAGASNVPVRRHHKRSKSSSGGGSKAIWIVAIALVLLLLPAAVVVRRAARRRRVRS